MELSKILNKCLNDVQYSFDIRYMTFFYWKYGRISFQIPRFPWHIYLRHPSLKHWRCISPCSIEMHVIGTLENAKKIFLTYKRKQIIYLRKFSLELSKLLKSVQSRILSLAHTFYEYYKLELYCQYNIHINWNVVKLVG